MGLRLLAHYYDRNEALIVSALLDSAGVANWVENQGYISLHPFNEIALGGYRVRVPEEELAKALNVIDEARKKRSFEGERLSQHVYLTPFLLLWLFAGYPLPLRTSKWHDPVDPREH